MNKCMCVCVCVSFCSKAMRTVHWCIVVIVNCFVSLIKRMRPTDDTIHGLMPVPKQSTLHWPCENSHIHRTDFSDSRSNDTPSSNQQFAQYRVCWILQGSNYVERNPFCHDTYKMQCKIAQKYIHNEVRERKTVPIEETHTHARCMCLSLLFVLGWIYECIFLSTIQERIGAHGVL